MDDHKTDMLLDVVVTVCGIVAAYLAGELVGRWLERKRGRSLASEAEAYLAQSTKES